MERDRHYRCILSYFAATRQEERFLQYGVLAWTVYIPHSADFPALHEVAEWQVGEDQLEDFTG